MLVTVNDRTLVLHLEAMAASVARMRDQAREDETLQPYLEQLEELAAATDELCWLVQHAGNTLPGTAWTYEDSRDEAGQEVPGQLSIM